jgi:hypothetical protein
MPPQMSLNLTLAIGAALVLLTVGAGWMGAKPPNPLRGPRMLPWRFIMLLAATGVILMLVHVANLLGVSTGR